MQRLSAPLRHLRPFRVDEATPQKGCFLACLCNIDIPPGNSLRLFCYPSHREEEVRNILSSLNEAYLYGSGNSSEPLCEGDEIHVKLLSGLEKHEDTKEDELKLK